MIGTLSISGWRPMITPAACTPHCRLRPSSLRAWSMTSAAPGVGLVAGPELRGLLVALVGGVEDPRQRDVLAHDARRHELGQLVTHRVGAVEHAGGVLDGGLRLDRPVGDDLADPLLAVLLRHVADDLAAAAVVEVDVDVGHGDALGVEEPLEDQAVRQRVEVGDAHRVGGQRAGGRATAGADADALVLGPVDEVGDHEEVPREAHLADDPDLVVGLLAHVVGDAARPALVQPALDLLHEPGGLVLALGQREPGHEVGALGERHLALLGDQQRVVARLGQVGEERAHLRGALQVVAVAVEAEAVGLVEPGPGLDAQERVVGLRVLLVRVVQVVGAQQRDAEVLGDGQQRRLGLLLDRQAVIHDLGVEVLLAEDVLEVRRRLRGRGPPSRRAATC